MTTLHTLDEVAAVVAAAASISPARAIVGVAGSPGAGKTTLGEQLVERLGGAAQLLSMDGFHLPPARLVELGRRDRMGAPDTFDVDGFVALLDMLRFSGDTVTAPGFDRETEEATPGGVVISPEKRIIVVEGNYLLHDDGGWQRVAPLLDVSLFVAIDRDIRLVRLIERHERFGKTATDARAWALGPDEANARLIEATATRADHVIRVR